MILDSFEAKIDNVGLKTSHHKLADFLFKEVFFLDKDSYVQISSRGITSQMNIAKNELLRNRYIERHKQNYSVDNKRCYRYRFTAKGWKSLRITIRNRDKVVSKKFYTKDFLHKWLYECFNNISTSREGRPEETRLKIIEANKLWITHKSEKARVYSSITNLDRDSRDSIRLYGKELIKLDIKTAQPYFLAVLSNDESLLEFCVNPDKDLYSYIGNLLGIHDRETAKNTFLPALFDSERQIYRQAVWNALKTHFRGAYDYAREVKREDYSALSRLLEQKEVELMTRVWRLLAVEKIPYLTIHDCLMILPEDEKRVRDIFSFCSGDNGPLLKRE